MTHYAKLKKYIHPCLALGWALLILSSVFFNFHAFLVKKNIQVNLLDLLPCSQYDALKEVHHYMEDSQLEKRFFILIGHTTPTVAQKAIVSLQKFIISQGLSIKENRIAEEREKYHILFHMLYPFRAGFLAQKDKERLSTDPDLSFFTKRALSYLAVPAPLMGAVNFSEDPFLLYTTYIKQFLPESIYKIDENQNLFLYKAERYWYIFQGTLTASAFSTDNQKKIVTKLETFLEKLKQESGIHVLKQGVIFYAASGFNHANKEITLIGCLSLLGICCLLFWFFRSLKPLWLGVSIIIGGISSGITLCLIVFQSIHLVALLFGCSLMGITIDYVLHYACAFYTFNKNSQNDKFFTLKLLMPALKLGVFSSVFGYAVLSIVPFPGIQQMATLGAFGILFSFISLCAWAPYIMRGYSSLSGPLSPQFLLAFFMKLQKLSHMKKFKCIWIFFTILFFSIAIFKTTFVDDVHVFQSLDKQLKKEEEQIRTLVDINYETDFFVIRVESIDDLLQKEEAFLSDSLVKQIVDRAISQLYPSLMQQKNNRHFLKTKLYREQWPLLREALGLEDKKNDASFGLDNSFAAYDKNDFMSLPTLWQSLIHFDQSGVTSRILLKKDVPESVIASIAHKFPDVLYVNPRNEYKNLFKTYRQTMLIMEGFIFLGLLIILTLLKDFNAACKIILPLVLTLMNTSSFLALFGIAFTLFHVMASILLICIGIDYALFLNYRTSTGNKQERSILTANILCALTTLMSFGMLIFSQTKAVHDFGLFIFIGIIFCFLNTTLFLIRDT